MLVRVPRKASRSSNIGRDNLINLPYNWPLQYSAITTWFYPAIWIVIWCLSISQENVINTYPDILMDFPNQYEFMIILQLLEIWYLRNRYPELQLLPLALGLPLHLPAESMYVQQPSIHPILCMSSLLDPCGIQLRSSRLQGALWSSQLGSWYQYWGKTSPRLCGHRDRTAATWFLNGTLVCWCR